MTQPHTDSPVPTYRSAAYVITFVVVPLFLPFAILFYCGTIDFSDLTFYSLVPKLFAAQFWHGELYPRWLMEGNAGYGSPVFFFYPPLSAFLMSPLVLLESLDPDGTFRLVGSMLLATITSGVLCFWWLRHRFSAREALVGAVIYVLLPYRLIYVYLDFNLAQCWALAWFALILGAQARLHQGKPYATAMLAGGIALLAVTHVPSSVTFLPVLLPLAFTAPRPQWRRAVLLLGLALIQGFALAALYLLPMELNQDAIAVDGLLQDARYMYQNNFMSMKFLLTVPFVVAFAACIFRRAGEEERNELRIWYGVGLFLLFMMTALSRPIWDAVGFMRYLQFPVSRYYAPLLPLLALVFTYGARFYGKLNPALCVLTLLGSALLCVAVSHPVDFTSGTEMTFPGLVQFIFWYYAPLYIALLPVVLYLLARGRRLAMPLLIAAFLYSHVAYAYNMYVRNQWPHPASPKLTEIMGMVHNTRIVPPPEYRPLNVDPGVISLPSLMQLAPTARQAEIPATDGTARLVSWQPRRIEVKVDVVSPSSTLTLRHFYFPGWSATDNGALAATLLYATDHFGFIALDLAQGHHDIVFRLDEVKGEREGKFVSLIALLILAGSVFYIRENQARASAADFR